MPWNSRGECYVRFEFRCRAQGAHLVGYDVSYRLGQDIVGVAAFGWDQPKG